MMAGPSAQYVIDIAAKMSGLDPTVAGLEALTSELAGVSKDSAAFSDAITGLSTQLDAAKAASVEANAALAAGATEYRQLERAADMLAKKAERAALKNAGIVPADLKAKADAAALAVTQFAGKLGRLEDEASKATVAERALGKQLRDVQVLQGHVNRTFARSSEDVAKLQSGLAAVGGPLGRLGQRAAMPIKAFADLRQVIGGTRAIMVVAAVGFAALAAVVVLLTAAMAAGVVAAAAYAVKLGDTRRAAGLAKEAFDAMNPAFAGLDYSGLTRDTGVASDRLQALAKSLRDAKVAADDMPTALRAASIAEAALGQGGADAFIADIKAGKLAVQDFAATTEQKLGGIVARQMLGLEAQGARFRSNISALFGGLNIEPVLKGLRTLVGLFDENEAAGKAIKFLFETIFQPLIDQAQNAAYVIEAFALGFLIGMTKLYIQLKPYFKSIAKFFGFKDTSLSDVLKSATKAGEFFAKAFAIGAAIFGVFAVAVGAIVLVLGAVAVALMVVAAAAVALAVAIGAGVAFAIDKFVEAIKWSIEATQEAGAALADFVVDTVVWFASLPGRVVAALADLGRVLLGIFRAGWAEVEGYLSGVSLADIGLDLIKGLASGILSGVSVVVGAIKSAVGSAIKTAKSALGIGSPSRVFANIGVDTTKGYAGGVDKAAPEAHKAVLEMTAAPPPSEIMLPPPELVAPPELATPAPLFSPAPMLTAPMPEIAPAPLAEVPVPALAAQAPAAQRPGPGAQTPTSAGKSLDLHGATFNFYGVEGAEDAEARFGELLTQAVEGDAAALGAAQGVES